MKKNLFITLLILTSASILFGQNKNDQAFYVELLGNGALYSLNYEHNIHASLNGRIGISYYGGFGDWILFPVMVNYYKPESTISPEIGVGFLLGPVDTPKFFDGDNGYFATILTATAGFRFQPKSSRFLFKLSYTPFYNPKNEKFTNSGGLSFGFRF